MPGYALKLLWLSWCNSFTTQIHYTNIFKFLSVFFPLDLFWHFLQEIWADPGKPSLCSRLSTAMRAVHGYTQQNIPHEGVLCTCCCPPRLSTLLLDRVQGTCSQPPGSWETKGEEAWQGMWYLSLLRHLLAHTVLQETEHFLCPTRWFDYNTQSLLPPLSLASC